MRETTMGADLIKEMLPHRDSMLLIDEVTLDGEVACGRYAIRGDEWFLDGHFPGNPIVPGVILCEMMAQSACVLLTDSGAAAPPDTAADTAAAAATPPAAPPAKTPMFTSLDKVRFKNSVRPGDVLETRCELTARKGPFVFAKATGSVAGTLCVSAEFSFALV